MRFRNKPSRKIKRHGNEQTKKAEKINQDVEIASTIIKMQQLMEEYLKENNSAYNVLMEEILACIDKIDNTKNNLRIEADKNDNINHLTYNA